MTRTLATLLAIGGLAWLVKVSLIVANGGTNTNEGMVAVLFFVGLACIVIGSTAIGLHLARRRGALLRVLAAIASIVVTFVLFSVFEAVLTPLFVSSLPKWGEEEVEIVALAVFALVTGLILRRASRAQVAVSPAS